MAKPGFYNDNEYRAYPFVHRSQQPGHVLPNSAIVDAGIILGLLAFEEDVPDYTVWLHSVSRDETGFTFTFKYAGKNLEAAATPLSFFREDTDDDWAIVYARADVWTTIPGATPDTPTIAAFADAAWEGFIATGPLTDLRAALPIGQTFEFEQDAYQLEPARIQNQHKAYLRSISVANYDRSRIPQCGTTPTQTGARTVFVNAPYMRGDIRLKEGYNCQITQTDRANEITIAGVKNAGAKLDKDICDNAGEIPLFPGEKPPHPSKFLGGGPACNELISTINGVGGSSLNFVGGTGVAITTEDNKITVSLRENTQTNCVNQQE